MGYNEFSIWCQDDSPETYLSFFKSEKRNKHGKTVTAYIDSKVN